MNDFTFKTIKLTELSLAYSKSVQEITELYMQVSNSLENAYLQKNAERTKQVDQEQIDNLDDE